MAERQRFGQDDRNRGRGDERDAHGRQDESPGRSPWQHQGPDAAHEREAQWSGARSGQQWQGQGAGYGAHGGGSWEHDDAGQRWHGEGAQGGQHGAPGTPRWEGPHGGQGAWEQRTFRGAGYGPGGAGGYGSTGGQGHEPSQGGWQDERQRQHASNFSYGGGYGPQSYSGSGTRGGSYGTYGPAHGTALENSTRSGGWGPEGGTEPGQVANERWMGEGFGGTSSGTWTARHAGWSRQGRRAAQHWPKSYSRSDERVREDLYERIVQHHYIDASEVTIEVKDGKVTLDGTVPERHMRHDIENIADDCPGVKDIDNHIRVRRRGFDEGQETSGMGSGSSTTSGKR